MSAQVINLLSSTLNPSMLQSSQREIEKTRSNQGFATELMIIADDSGNDMKIRQSALIVLKNMVYDEHRIGGVVNSSDYEIIKGSILDALARQWGNKQLTPTLRQIIYLIAELDYPDRWPQILPTVLNNITTSADFNTVSSSVQALKAITTVCGKSMQKQVTLNNLCNKMVIPLFQLANKLFANYSQQTQTILVSIFKIFHLAMFYHLPNIIINNIHSLMVFCKKILDLSIADMSPLKIACLKILSRIYSRHISGNVSYKLIKFAQQFHNKYSIAMVQTFIKQLMDNTNNSQIINISLNCLTCIYKNHDKSSQLIDKYYKKLLQFCIQKCKQCKKFKQGQSVGSYITYLKQQRNQLIDFIIALFRCNDKILGDLIEYLNKGDQGTQQLILYIFSALSQQIQDFQQLYGSMSQFIITYILPILSGNNSYIMKARGCQIISVYNYIQIPQQNLQSIFQFIYNCLTQSQQTYLNIYALQAFTKLICKYDSFLEIIIPYLQNILKVYTNLMKQSNGEVYQVIKSFQLFLGQIDGKYLQNCAIDLIKFLTQIFYEHAQQKNDNFNNNNNENSEDDLQQQQDEDENLGNARQGCLACIRQIISTQNLSKNLYPTIINDCVLPLSVSILSDPNLLHFQQCLNILNLCVYKSQNLPNGMQQFFKIFTYAILGLPNQLGNINLQNQYKQILQIVCVNPDDDIVSNVIGFFRNFIAKARNNLRDLKDQLGISFLQYIYKIVQYVENARNDKNQYKYKKSQRFLILTLYTSMIEYQFLRNDQFLLIVQNVMKWCTQNNDNNQNINININNTNIYIQILLMSVYENADLTVQKLNIQWFIQQLLNRVNLFKYQYQLQRIILGITKLMDKQMLKNQQSAIKIVNCLPQFVNRLVNQRISALPNNNNNNDNNNNYINKAQQQQIDIQQQAEQDLIAENTHMGNFPIKNQQKQKQYELQINQQADIDSEYNQYYYSPFININQLQYLTNVLKNSPYTNLLSNQNQQQLLNCISSAPPKQISN